MNYKILVIEDEASLREEIVDQLVFAGYEVFEAGDGLSGIEQLRQCHPDAIICDISMPEMDGYQVLQEVRGSEDTAIIPFIFLTARSDKSFMRHGMELGADDYLTKPFTRGELLSALQTRLKQAGTIRQRHFSQMEQARNQLVHMITHELRTPLVGVKLSSDLLDRHLERLDPQEIKDIISTLKSGGERLHHLIQQFTLYFQLESGFVSQETVQGYGSQLILNELIPACVTAARQSCYRNHEMDVRLHLPAHDVKVFAYAPLVKHALVELLINALNFSPPEAEVIVHLEHDTTSAYITLIDSGAGIPSEQIEQVQKPFQQLNREKQEQQGAGLGLTLIRKIVALHGGLLQFESNMHGQTGTTVTVRLPF